MTAKEYMCQFSDACKDIHGIEKRLEEVEAGRWATSNDRRSIGCVSDRVQKQALDIIEQKEKLEMARANYADIINRGAIVINAVGFDISQRHARCLELRYRDRWTWEQVANELDCAPATARLIERQALKWIEDRGIAE